MIVNFPSHYTRIKCFLQEAIFDKSTLTPGASSRLHWPGRHRARTSQPALSSPLVTKQLNTRQCDGRHSGGRLVEHITNRADKSRAVMHEAAPRNGRCGNAVETTVVASRQFEYYGRTRIV